MAAVTIRTAGRDDLATLLALYQHLNPNDLALPPSDELERLWNQIIERELPLLLLAEADGLPVATCALAVIPGLTRGARPFGTIENVVTHADYRRRGIATQLLEHAVGCAWERGCYKVMLMTGSTRDEVLRFYDRAGFKRGGKTGFVMWNPLVGVPPRPPAR